MKIALVSDTHGVCRKELFDHIKKCDYLILTGDFDNERTYNRFLNCGIPMYAVRGNCDHGEWASYLHEFVSVPIFILSITKLTCLLISRMRIL